LFVDLPLLLLENGVFIGGGQVVIDALADHFLHYLVLAFAVLSH
jgi:hypothetical protein